MMNLLDKYKMVLESIQKHPKVDSVIVFGSTIKEIMTPLSDLDIAIIFDEKSCVEDRVEVLSYGNSELDLSDFSKLNLSMQFNILTKGKFLKQSDDINILRRDVMNQWFDFKPRLKKMYEQRGYDPSHLD